MAVKITDIEISCDPILDEAILSDVNQEVGFLSDDFKARMQQEELMDQCAREAAGFCEQCNGTGQYMDCDPHRSRYATCESCNGVGFIKDQK